MLCAVWLQATVEMTPRDCTPIKLTEHARDECDTKAERHHHQYNQICTVEAKTVMIL